MMRINVVCDIIKKNHHDKDLPIVIDVGSDHAKLSIELLQRDLSRSVINIEKRIKPLQSGIKNLVQNNLLKKTINIHNDGLRNICNFLPQYLCDYLVIMGLGGRTIVNILDNMDQRLHVDYLVVCAHQHELFLRTWLQNNYWKIIDEEFIQENKKYYSVILLEKTAIKAQYNECEIVFGAINIQKYKPLFHQYLLEQQSICHEILKNFPSPAIIKKLALIKKILKNK